MDTWDAAILYTLQTGVLESAVTLLSEARRIKEEHHGSPSEARCADRCNACDQFWPCDARLATEVIEEMLLEMIRDIEATDKDPRISSPGLDAWAEKLRGGK